MRSTSSYAAVLAASLVTHAQAQFLVNELSFGYGTRIAPEGQSLIPNFSIQGRPGIPEILSNKLILTPVYPGNQRGAVWSDKQIQNENWIADVEFRANGPERGSGNLNIWVARDGSHRIGAESIYSAGKFEGLALVIDQYSGTGGMLRGFLNDGSTDFKTHHSVDSLAFGQCNFSYRNLGRPTQIKIRHSTQKFSVEVAGRPCFSSDKIRLPAGYNVGLTASSSDNPDSFEVYKLVVLTDDNHNYGGSQSQHESYASHQEAAAAAQDNTHHHQQQQQQQQQQPPYQGKQHFGRGGQKQVEDPFDNVIPDQKPESITNHDAQFADLHNRLQSVNHHLTSIFRTINQNQGVGEQRHAELSSMIGELKSVLTRLDKMDVMEHRLGDIEKEMRSMRSEMAGRLRDSENAIKYHVSDKHEEIAEKVHKNVSGGHKKLILWIVGTQVVLGGGYFYYKRSKANPKKYL